MKSAEWMKYEGVKHNDVDYCLKVREKGLWWFKFIDVLYHYESLSGVPMRTILRSTTEQLEGRKRLRSVVNLQGRVILISIRTWTIVLLISFLKGTIPQIIQFLQKTDRKKMIVNS